MTFHTVLRLKWCLFVGLQTSCCDSVLMALWSLVSVCTARALRSLYALDFVDDRRRRLSRFNRYVYIKVSWQSFCDSDRLFIPYAALPRSPSLTLTHPRLTHAHSHSPSLTHRSPSQNDHEGAPNALAQEYSRTSWLTGHFFRP